jgi:hypothetical protein
MNEGTELDAREAHAVSVLLSVFKPNMNWLSAQIQSIENQVGVNVTLELRNDNGVFIDLPMADKSVRLEPSEHLGVGVSYLTLLSKSSAGGVAFCDQDDLWHESKLTMQERALAAFCSPAASVCDFEVVNSELQKIAIRRPPRRITRFTFLFRNSIPGFSMYLNDQAREFLKESWRFLPQGGFHDWWSLLAISQIGAYKRVPHVLASYRQHDSNFIGLSLSVGSRFVRLKQKIKNGLHESKALIVQMINYLEFVDVETQRIDFLKQIILGMEMNRLKRLQILVNQGILSSPISEIVNTVLLYVFPKKITSNA